MLKRLCSIVVLPLVLSNCSTETVESFSVADVWVDSAGVATGKTTQGRRFVVLSPYIAEVTAELEANPPDTSNDDTEVSDFPIVGRTQGYVLRRANISGLDTLLVHDATSDEEGLVVAKGNTGFLSVIAGPKQLSSVPTGEFTYRGVYTVATRYDAWAEVGDLTLVADFDAKTFSISGQSTWSSLSGAGYIDNNTGMVSSSTLDFSATGVGDYRASTIGYFGDGAANEVAGVWYTNNSDPDFAGGYIAKR